METISKAIKKKDHDSKASGRALYMDDYVIADMLFGRLLKSTKARARVSDIIIPDLPEGYLVVDNHDIPGTNRVQIILDDTPIFAEKTVEFVGDPILMVVGPDYKKAENILEKIVIFMKNWSPYLICASQIRFSLIIIMQGGL